MEESSSFKRAMMEARRLRDAGDMMITTGSEYGYKYWEDQRQQKRPRLHEYREPHVESDDDDEVEKGNMKPPNDCEHADSGSFSGLSEPEEGHSDHKLSSRWIIRKDSKCPSVSSVITEHSESDVVMAIAGEEDAGDPEQHLYQYSCQTSSQPIESVIRNMESWSVTRIRALRRNNLYDTNRLPDESTEYRANAANARRNVMRTLRRSARGLGPSQSSNMEDETSSR